MNSKDIKILLLTNDLTVTELAKNCQRRLGRKVRREEVSMCIHKHRNYPIVQKAIADELGLKVEVLFGHTDVGNTSEMFGK